MEKVWQQIHESLRGVSPQQRSVHHTPDDAHETWGGDYVSFRTHFETAAICLSASPCIPASRGQQCTGLQEPFTDRTAQHLLLEKLGENFQTSAALAWNTSSAKAQVNLVPSNSVTSQRTDPVQWSKWFNPAGLTQKRMRRRTRMTRGRA